MCAFAVSAITLILPLCVSYLTKNVLRADRPDATAQELTVGALMVGLVALHTASNAFVDYQGHMMGTLMERDMRRDLFAQYQKLSFDFHDSQRTGQLMSRMTNDLYNIGEFAHHAPEDFAVAVLKFTGVFVILLTVNPSLTAVVFALFPIMILWALYFSRQMNRSMRTVRQRIGEVNAQLEDTLAGIRIVQSFTNQLEEQRKFDEQNQHFVESTRVGHKSEAYFSNGMTAFTQLMPVVVVVFGGLTIVNASLGLPDLITYLLYVAILSDPIQRFVNVARVYQEGSTGFERFAQIMELRADIQDAPEAIELPRVHGNVTFKDVSFKYSEGANHVLEHLTLTIHAGEFVALVGPSGVGKTTLCSLIPRFYDVTRGQILIDGQDIRIIGLDSLRRQIGVVQQDVYLFAGTVAENIRYGNLEASVDDLVEAAKRANAHDFIVALPQGYDTDIGQRGVKLSGGQKQRLSIARVFLKNPPILILDEATSALDNESERSVQAALETLASNRTTIVIAHRLSTVRNAQRIIVLTDEGIAEQGTHEQLIESGSVYASLYNTQLRL